MRLLAALVAALLLAGCGVPSDDAPRPLDPEVAPFGVFAPETAAPAQGDVQVALYFVQQDVLVPVVREVPAPATPEQVLRALFTGLTESDRTEQLSSAIPAAVELVGVAVEDRIAVVSLGRLSEQVQVLAYAQMVATLDALDSVDGVRFRTGDSDLRVPRGDGSLTEAPVDSASYAQQLGAAAPTATAVPPAPVTPAPAGSPAG